MSWVKKSYYFISQTQETRSGYVDVTLSDAEASYFSGNFKMSSESGNNLAWVCWVDRDKSSVLADGKTLHLYYTYRNYTQSIQNPHFNYEYELEDPYFIKKQNELLNIINYSEPARLIGYTPGKGTEIKCNILKSDGSEIGYDSMIYPATSPSASFSSIQQPSYSGLGINHTLSTGYYYLDSDGKMKELKVPERGTQPFATDRGLTSSAVGNSLVYINTPGTVTISRTDTELKVGSMVFDTSAFNHINGCIPKIIGFVLTAGGGGGGGCGSPKTGKKGKSKEGYVTVPGAGGGGGATIIGTIDLTKCPNNRFHVTIGEGGRAGENNVGTSSGGKKGYDGSQGGNSYIKFDRKDGTALTLAYVCYGGGGGGGSDPNNNTTGEGGEGGVCLEWTITSPSEDWRQYLKVLQTINGLGGGWSYRDNNGSEARFNVDARSVSYTFFDFKNNPELYTKSLISAPELKINSNENDNGKWAGVPGGHSGTGWGGHWAGNSSSKKPFFGGGGDSAIQSEDRNGAPGVLALFY